MKKRKRPSVGEALAALESRAPSALAESWDNCGLLIGDPRASCARAVAAVDLVPATLRAARKHRAGLIVLHHPPIFPSSRGWNRFTPDPRRPAELRSLVFEAARAGIAIAAWHTCFDRGGLDAMAGLARSLGATPAGRLLEKPAGSLVKLVVFVPATHVEPVRTALARAGAGRIGAYGECFFAATGEGTFRGDAGTRPFLGRPGKLERAVEARLETVVPRGLEGPVLRALRKSHPYEEIAYDLYPLEQGPAPRTWLAGLGYGFFGELGRAEAPAALARRAARVFGVRAVRLTAAADGPARIGRIAFSPGKGGAFVPAAIAAGAGAFLTGEVDYHDALRASRAGMTLIEVGHSRSERWFPRTVARWLGDAGIPTLALDPGSTDPQSWVAAKRDSV